MSCSNDSDVQNEDATAFKATTFISTPYQEEQQTAWGTTLPAETRMNVIGFRPGDHLFFKKVDKNNTVILGSRGTRKYKLDFPRVYDIENLFIFNETQITIQTGSKMQFTAGGLIYKETSQEFD